MTIERQHTLSFVFGLLASLVTHVVIAAVVLLVIESSTFGAAPSVVVFSVTLEGGEKLGGINQAPDPKAQATKVLPNVPPSSEVEVSDRALNPPEEKERELDAPTIVEDKSKEFEAARLKQERERQEAEKREKEVERQKREHEEKKRKAEEEQRRKKEEERRRDEEKQRAEAEKLKAEQEKKARDAQLRKAIQNATRRYAGESANAGGEGFGAAALGGKGMGGGQLQSLEFITYRNALENHVKSGWRWLPSPQRYRAVVSVLIRPDGTVEEVRIDTSSGNPSFDDSVVRAVQKASPVPPAPAHLYEQFFRQVRMTFDSQE